jgi:formylglycine-generating enzyme required for sulfatase activity
LRKSHNVAEEYADLFSLPKRSPTEEAWQFRARVARTLEQMGETMRAHEALWNERMNSDPCATGMLSRGYEETFITSIAKHIEALYRARRRDETPSEVT